MERIEIAPIFDRFCVCSDHYDGELQMPGDALGKDCMIAAFLPEKPYFMRLYRNDGRQNEDWFSWNAKVYAPISGTVTKVHINSVINQPGVPNPSFASCITLVREDKLTVCLCHVQSPVVSEGDRVKEGQHMAFVGNNGYARNPHIHLGAFRGDTPLAIGFDPAKVAEMAGRVGKHYWRFGITEQEYMEKS